MWRRTHGWQCDMIMLTALTLYVLTRCLPVVVGLDRTGQSVLGVALCGMLLWISESVPIGVTALAVLVLLGTVPGLHSMHVFGGFALPVVFFLIGAVGIAAAVEQTGLAHRAAHLLLRGARGKPARLYFQMLACLPGLAVFVPSAITRNAILVPAYREALATLGLSAADGHARALMLALGMLNPLASSMLLTGGLVSMTAAALLGGVSWLRWFMLMAIPYYVLLLLDGVGLWLTMPRAERPTAVVRPAEPHHRLRPDECRTILVLLVTTALWLTDAWHGLTPAIPALLATILLVLPRLGVLTWHQLETRLSWGLILTVGASLSLANAMTTSTVGPWLGQCFASAALNLQLQPLAFVVALVVTVTVVHLAITNLAACLALLLPIATSTAVAAGLNPLVAGLIVTVVVDAVILYPVQTATNLLVYETGYFSAAEVRRFGLWMFGLTVVVLVVITLPYWRLIGLSLTAH